MDDLQLPLFREDLHFVVTGFQLLQATGDTGGFQHPPAIPIAPGPPKTATSLLRDRNLRLLGPKVDRKHQRKRGTKTPLVSRGCEHHIVKFQLTEMGWTRSHVEWLVYCSKIGNLTILKISQSSNNL